MSPDTEICNRNAKWMAVNRSGGIVLIWHLAVNSTYIAREHTANPTERVNRPTTNLKISVQNTARLGANGFYKVGS